MKRFILVLLALYSILGYAQSNNYRTRGYKGDVNVALLRQGRRTKIIRIKTATFPIVKH